MIYDTTGQFKKSHKSLPIMTTQTLRTEGWSICHTIIEFVYDCINVIPSANTKSPINLPNYDNTNVTDRR